MANVKRGDTVRIVPVYMECLEGGSSKFWEIAWTGPKSWTTAWGRIGAKGTSEERKFSSSWSASDDHRKIVLSKRKKGYVKRTRPASRATVQVHGFDGGLGLVISTNSQSAMILNETGASEEVPLECLEVVLEG